jgi:redoxin
VKIQYLSPRYARVGTTECPKEDAMAIKVGDRLPEGTLMELGASGPSPVNVTEATRGKKIAIFGIPGAFTPT